MPFPRVTSGAVTSMPIFTRRGRPSLSLASRPPSGRTLAALRVKRSIIGGLDYPRPGALPEKYAPAETSADPQAQTPRPPPRPRSPGSDVVHLRPLDCGRGEDPAARSEPSAARDAGEHLYLRLERLYGARDPARLAGAGRRPVGGHLTVDEARDRRDRGQAVL